MKIGDGCYFKDCGINYGRIINFDENNVVVLAGNWVNIGDNIKFDSTVEILPRNKVARTEDL